MSEIRACQAVVGWIRQHDLRNAPPHLFQFLKQRSPAGYEYVARALLASAEDRQRDSGMLLMLAAPRLNLYWDVLAFNPIMVSFKRNHPPIDVICCA